MCGITGVLYAQPEMASELLSALVKRMSDKLIHRGPDDCGEWVDANAGIGLGHRRLSILDLSPAGHQPMQSANKRYVIAFNGEIYNFKEIRKDLEKSGVHFRGYSDTEVLLENIALFGLDETLVRLNGMFAIALWDKEDSSLTLCRDRIGKKPLYYGRCNNVFLFGSELKSIKQHPSFEDEVDRSALAQFIQYGWLNGPATIYQNIKKLQPGSYIKITRSNMNEVVTPVVYWSIKQVAENGVEKPYAGNYEQATNELDSLIKDAVNNRMIADVELGALLSGGIDSSLVVAIMQNSSSRKVKTFSIGFDEVTHNEAVHAKNIAEYLQTDHTELYVTPKECMEVIPSLSTMYDEPLGDVSQIPTYLVSKLAKEQVKVVLTGDGGDEFFAGYTRYFRCMEHWAKHQKIPLAIRPMLGQVMDVTAKALWGLAGDKIINAEIKDWKRLGEKLEKRARRIGAKSPLALFVKMMARYKEIDSLVLNSGESNTFLDRSHEWPQFEKPILNMMLMDAYCYLPDDILVKVDRASMAASVEARAPLLDKNIIEFSWQLPFEMKVDEFGGKRILKNVLSRYIPKDLTDRKKMGFGAPVGQWLRGPLKDWAEDLLNPSKIKNQSYLDSVIVQNLWKQHQSGWRNHSDILWSILMFQDFLQTRK